MSDKPIGSFEDDELTRVWRRDGKAGAQHGMADPDSTDPDSDDTDADTSDSSDSDS